ncbi:MAG: RNA polymerase sigma factor [Verrucomicrobiales bacterium]|nr:RNA polymerase sigma factor [Verrucomicrobiales bacterium]
MNPNAMTCPEQPAIPPPAAPTVLPDRDFAALYTAHAKPVYYLALRLLGDPTRAEDAAHDVFLKAWRSFDRFRGDSSVRTWLYRITLNHCRNLQGSWQQHHILPGSDNPLWEQAADVSDSPLQAAENHELGERIQRTLDALPPEYRELLLLVADEELSYAAAAELTGQTPDAVRGKLHRARRAFAAAFAKTA